MGLEIGIEIWTGGEIWKPLAQGGKLKLWDNEE